MTGKAPSLAVGPPWEHRAVRVTVVPYDDDWPAAFRRIEAELDAALASVDVRSIEHVGSTAVPGLPAKPVIDVDVVVDAAQLAPAIAALGCGGLHVRGRAGHPRPARRHGTGGRRPAPRVRLRRRLPGAPQPPRRAPRAARGPGPAGAVRRREAGAGRARADVDGRVRRGQDGRPAHGAERGGHDDRRPGRGRRGELDGRCRRRTSRRARGGGDLREPAGPGPVPRRRTARGGWRCRRAVLPRVPW
ncbi:MAG: GrpB family protein [Cellulomonas sp.]|nr:GrpB family protein [Cellulomonas sp.]